MRWLRRGGGRRTCPVCKGSGLIRVWGRDRRGRTCSRDEECYRCQGRGWIPVKKKPGRA